MRSFDSNSFREPTLLTLKKLSVNLMMAGSEEKENMDSSRTDQAIVLLMVNVWASMVLYLRETNFTLHSILAELKT